MRKAFIILTGILFTLLSAACRPFTADLDSDLGYWSSEAFVVSADINTETQTDASGTVSVASAKDVIITLKVQNPKSFKLVMPSASETRNIVDFAQLAGTKPVVDSDYTLAQPDDDRKVLTLTYKADFLKNSEWGEKDVSSTITLYADDGREFKHPYTFKIKANTPPPTPGFTVAKTKDSPAYYVLCITVPDMDKKVQGSRLLHKDITGIEVSGTQYPFSVNEAENRFEKPESDLFIEYSAVEKLDDSDAADVPSGGWVLYYKTDVEVKDGAAKKDYTVRLADAKGLVSGILNASTKPNKAEAETVEITKGDPVSGSGNSEGDPVIIACDSTGAELSVSSKTAGVTVHGTLTAGTAEPIQYNGNPITVPLPLNGAGEKTYKLEYYTDGEGFARTDVKTVYYKILKEHTVTFDANTGAYPGGSTAARKNVLYGSTVTAPDPLPVKAGYVVNAWYRTADGSGQAWNFAADTVTSDITLYAKWTEAGDTPYTVKHYQQKLDGTYPDPETLKDTDTDLKGRTGAALSVDNGITLRPYPGFELDKLEPASPSIGADGKTVVKVLYKRKNIKLTFNPNGGKIDGNTGNKEVSGKYGAALTPPTATWDGHTFSKWDPSVPGTFPSEEKTYTAQWDLILYNVTFSVAGGSGTISATPEGGSATSASPVSVEHGKKITFTASPDTGWEVDNWSGNVTDISTDSSTGISTAKLSNITDATNKNVKVTFKKKTYKVDFSVAGGNGTLKATPQGGSETPTSPVWVEHGKNITFTAYPDLGWEVASWSGDVIDISTDSSTGISTAKLSNITDATNKNVKVTFKKKVYTITFSVAGGNGTISAKPEGGSATSSSPASVEHGKKITFTATPATGWKVDNWSSNVTDISTDSSTGISTATLSNITAATNKNVTVTFKKKEYTVTFSVAGGNGTLKATPQGGSETQTSPVWVEHGKNITFTAYPDLGWEVDGWTGVTVTPSNSTTATLSDVKEPKNIKVKFYQSSIPNGTSWKDLVRAVKDAPDGATITINGTITATSASDDHDEIEVKKNITIKGKDASVILDANNLSRIFHVQDGKTLTLDTIVLKNGKAGGDKGGGVYVENGTLIMQSLSIITNCEAKYGGGVYLESGTFKMLGSAIVTNFIGSDTKVAGKDDVYLATGKTIAVDGTLSNNPAARITPESYEQGKKVLDGTIATGLSQNYKKFTVTPQDVGDGKMFWYITDAGKLKAEVEDLQTLKAAVQAAPDNTSFVIKLAGTISNLETVQIPNKKKIMLKADNASNPAILKCPNNGQAKYTYFDVQSGASLTLEGQITLQGVDYSYRKMHYALFVNYNGNAEIKNGVTITGFKNSKVTGTDRGTGPVFVGGTLTMSGGTIEKNTVENDGSSSYGGGGGVYVGDTGNFIMTGGTITENKTSGYNSHDGGGGVYVFGGQYGKGQFKMEGGTIEKNEGREGGGVLVDGIFDMTGGTITKNKATNDGKAVMLNYDFHWRGGQIKDNQGSGSVIGGNIGTYLHNTSGNTES